MKTYKNIFPRICSYHNLYYAWREAARGKRKSPEVAAFEYALIENLIQLEQELREGHYRPSPYRHFRITYPKPRRVSAALFRDRVVHHALVRQIEPIFEARFIHDSYACRVGKGTHRALDRAQYFARRYPYVLQCDVRQFFPSMDHEILRGLLTRHIACRRTMWLVDQILESGVGVLDDCYTPVYFPQDDPSTPRLAWDDAGSGQGLFAIARPRGLPIGNLCSQHWANLYLHPLDLFVKQTLHCKGYLRYSDDSLLFAAEKSTLHGWRDEIIGFSQTLRLTLHEEKAQVFPVKSGIPFLGWRLFPHHRRLRRENVRHAVRRLRWQQAAFARGELDQEKLTASIQAWLAHAAHGNTYQLRRRIMRRFVFAAERKSHVQNT
jgi:RNA-directed DNA polymerase